MLQNYFTKIAAFLVCFGLFWSCHSEKKDPTPEPEPITSASWVNLLDKDLSKWDKFIGVPHYSVNLPGYPKGDGMNGIPIGLNNDPLQVFKVEEINGDTVLVVSGQIYGGLSTKEELGNYHLKLDFKWGNTKYEPRLNAKRDNGILYHATGPQGKFWNVWMDSQEMQVQEGDMGDYFALGPGMDIRAVNRLEDNEQEWIYDRNVPLQQFGNSSNKGRCRRGRNNEKPHGQWNTLELICLGDKSMHIVNGEVVMVLENSTMRNGNGQLEPLLKGKIQLQSEGAEAFYRNIKIKAITEIPEQYR